MSDVTFTFLLDYSLDIISCEVTGFTLKPDGFFEGNPAIDLPADTNKASKLATGCCVSKG